MSSRSSKLAKRPVNVFRWMAGTAVPFALAVAAVLGPGCGSKSGSLYSASQATAGRGLPFGTASLNQVTRGRTLVASGGCADCHNGGKNDPSSATWLSGFHTGAPNGSFNIGPWTTFAANITPDNDTGIGMHTDLQIYNALKHGLDPEDTASVVITGDTPGQGNFPAAPHYLAPPMPWIATRHYSDEDLWAIVAYLKHGIKPVANAVPEVTGPPTTWASFYTDAAVGPAVLPEFPAASEKFNP